MPVYEVIRAHRVAELTHQCLGIVRPSRRGCDRTIETGNDANQEYPGQAFLAFLRVGIGDRGTDPRCHAPKCGGRWRLRRRRDRGATPE